MELFLDLDEDARNHTVNEHSNNSIRTLIVTFTHKLENLFEKPLGREEPSQILADF